MAWNKRYPLIMNPNARSERARKARQFIMEHATQFVIYATESVEESVALTSALVAQGEQTIIAAGGDGTINTVVTGLVGTDTALGILPTGTMNVFARELGIPSSDLPLALQVIDQQHTSQVDLFTVNDLPFIQMAGIGFDAHVIEETTAESKKVLGPLAYGMASARVLTEDPPQIQVQLHNGQQTDGACVLIGNGGLYGGQFKLFGNADNTDGLLDVLVVKDKGYEVLVDFLKGLMSPQNQGAFMGGGSIEYYQTASMTVTSADPVPLEVDGEYVGRDQEFRFVAAPAGRLKVHTPQEPVVTEWQETLSALVPFIPWSA